ncbi:MULTISPECIES: hypothetical protein [unclassified Mesorhizobium]|uniref:hypothetical protein n=1 Tax=unclassified Mesorhizobium TaxID=325217 RepID=UPI000FCC5991|nr:MULTISPECIES: hypothetical protein [unclassified Mesorhizobium]RUT88025.1 hypothetical protein EOD14_08310 [Mesorhizobium sp. M7A.T.Ca.US.000.02.1.1]RUT90717.1 hypothetical protein EOD15_17750 [Mesorhizobium sp. M7A.T.Ca.US.000.02.2.1]
MTKTDPEAGITPEEWDGYIDGGRYRRYLLVCTAGPYRGGVDTVSVKLVDGVEDFAPQLSRYGSSSHLHMVAYGTGTEPYGDLIPHLNSEFSPWHKQDWFKAHIGRWAEHMPRFSTKFPGLVAYYQTPQKRKAGVLTPIKPGKYLKKYLGDVLTEEFIQEQGLAWQSFFAPAELKVTQDADEVQEVYENGPNSCMSKSADEFAGECHPARVYAGPDLGVAYIGDIDNAAARCVVWPEKKIFARVYGDYHRMGSALEAAGYKEGDADDFRGARLRRFYNGDFYTVPYSDVFNYASDNGEYLIWGRGDVYMQHTNGTSVDNPQGCRCDDCEGRLGEDGGFGVHRGATVCESCYFEDYFTCSITDEVFPNDQLVSSPDDYNISRYATQRYTSSVFYCDGTSTWYPTNYFDYVTLADGDTYEQSYADEHAFHCEFSEEWHDNAEHCELDDGRVFAWEATRYLTQQFWDWKDGAVEIGRIDHPAQLELTLDLALAA